LPPLAPRPRQPSQSTQGTDRCATCGAWRHPRRRYNHAGGDFGDESLSSRRVINHGNRDSLFHGPGMAGGLVFAFHKGAVRQFLTTMPGSTSTSTTSTASGTTSHGHRSKSGWQFCQTSRTRSVSSSRASPRSRQYSARRPVDQPINMVVRFDAWSDGLRGPCGRGARVAHGRDAAVDFDRIAQAPASRSGRRRWCRVQHRESRHRVCRSRRPATDQPRSATRRTRVWYTCSRARVVPTALAPQAFPCCSWGRSSWKTSRGATRPIPPP
jgi:hypothetical protein